MSVCVNVPHLAVRASAACVYACVCLRALQKSRQSAYENEEETSVKYNNNSGK